MGSAGEARRRRGRRDRVASRMRMPVGGLTVGVIMPVRVRMAVGGVVRVVVRVPVFVPVFVPVPVPVPVFVFV